jgi:aminopeptidase
MPPPPMPLPRNKRLGRAGGVPTVRRMHDPRLDQLARQLVRYSTSLKAGDRLLIDLYDTPGEMGIALVRAAREAGAVPFVNLNDAKIARELYRKATVAQYRTQCAVLLNQMKKMDAYIAIRGGHNITETADVPPDRMALVMKHLRPVINHRVNKTRWCVLRWPTSSMAQQAGMSTEAFEDFYFRVCLLNYKRLLPAMRALKKLMDQTNQVHIKGPGTELRFSMKGLKSIACGGRNNIPDGECFTAPVKDSVEGVISYNAPTIYQGIAFDNIRLEFRKGKIVKATANDTAAINRILDSDPGARFIGEFALGFNPEIRHPMRDILFDEKIAGSFHFTPGQAYEGETDNGNRSQVHWDMVCIQREDYGGGEIWFDGKLIRKDGKFLPKVLQLLN